MKTLLKMALAVAICATLTAHANAQSAQDSTNVVDLVQSVNQDADARCQDWAGQWNSLLTELGNKQNLMKMAKTLASFEEKLSQGVDLFDSTSGKADRMRTAFRKNIVDERQLAQSMVDSFYAFQDQLMEESLELCRRGGVDSKVAESTFERYQVDAGIWEAAFDPLLRKAKSLAQEDWFRLAGVTAGSGIAADGILDAAKQSNIWNPKQGSMEEMVGGLLTHLFIEAVADQLTDPTEEFAKKLQAKFNGAKNELLDSQSGLSTAFKALTEIHKQTRSNLLGLGSGEGGK